jgi:hypothetical protein
VYHYKNFFKETNEFTEEQKEISQKIKHLSDQYVVPEILTLFNISQIQIILDELKSSKVKGHDLIKIFTQANLKKFSLSSLINFFQQTRFQSTSIFRL